MKKVTEPWRVRFFKWLIHQELPRYYLSRKPPKKDKSGFAITAITSKVVKTPLWEGKDDFGTDHQKDYIGIG